MLTEKRILELARQDEAYIQTVFRWLHQHPEVAHKEQKTNQYLRQELDKMGVFYLAPKDNITIAVIDSGKEGKTIGLRCDTDALPVQEDTGLSYASQYDGVMHACGHDAHMVMGIGAAKILNEHKEEWCGKVKIIFQPAEEGEDGSDQVIATGLVDDVDCFFAIHVWSPYKSGELHVSPITVSAAVNMFTIRIIGKGGHGAAPQECVDAIVAASSFVNSVQSVVSRAVSPMESAVVTIGSFHAGTVGNVIAQEAVLQGTTRTLNEETRQKVSDALRVYAEHTAQMYGCKAEVIDIRVSDAVQNDVKATEIARKCAMELVPSELIGDQRTMMLGDNFANFGVIAPYCYVQVGIADEEKQTNYAHHNGKFKVDEDVLPLCVAWMTSFAVRSAVEI